ncbi:MAG: hypothetical protein NT084_10375 [Bacteroidetes bacterium]|nr:hypothetical protein [Bacteroidota bacterium]
MRGLRNIIFILIFSVGKLSAQQLTFPYVDSATYAMYLKGDYNELIKLGSKAIKQGIDYPLLRVRMAEAAELNNDFSTAEKIYRGIVITDTTNANAHYQVAQNNIFLNRYDIAEYYAPTLNVVQRKNLGLKKHALIESVNFEAGLKHPGDTSRGNAYFGSVGISSRLFYRWTLYQSITPYGQTVTDSDTTSSFPFHPAHIGQINYYAKLHGQIFPHLGVTAAFYHFSLREKVTDWIPPQQNGPHMGPPTPPPTITQNGFYFVGGLRWNLPKLELHGEYVVGQMNSSSFSQMGVSFMYLPFGNLYSYVRGECYYQLPTNSGNGNLVFIPTLGFKLQKKVWFEATATFGTFNNLAQNEGAYFFNMYDATKLRYGGTLFLLAGKKSIFTLNYLQETKLISNTNSTYQQPSITFGLQWKL